ncbi:MAG: transporter substrate-binding domain-containing protein [Desulfobacteraceae bacterium]|nr:transporter substrate-binding domain-containing protein [Desulfobacteraceae bacterium]
MKRFLALSLALSLIATVAFAASPNDFTYMTEQYPPFNFDDNGQIKGIGQDIMVEMMKKLGVSQPVKMMPWANAYQQTLNKPNTCLFSMTRTEERDPLFKWVGPLSSTTVALTAMKSKNIKITSLADVNNYKVGVVRADIGEQLLLNGGVNAENLDATAKTLINIKKLQAGRIDMISYEENVTKWEIKNNGFNPDEFETVYILKEGELFYAFHKSTPDEIVRQFQKALDDLKADGTYQKILDQYLK